MENSQLPKGSLSESTMNQIGQAIAELRVEVAGGFARVDERLTRMDERLVGVDRQFVSIRQERRDGDEQTRSEMRVLIDSVRDDVRIFAEAHIALEQRVTTLERRPR